MKNFIFKYQAYLTVAIFFIIGALLYLPRVEHTFYYDDDWYSMYAARAAGPQILYRFYEMDSRPARAYVMIPLYLLFQGNPVYYGWSAYLFRVLGSLAMLWTLRLAWPDHKKETLLGAVLFLAYPGFLSQPVAVDFQSHLIGIWLAYLSIGLSLKAVNANSRIQRVLLWLAAVLSGWIYLGLMEYYIGFEMARFLLIALIFLRKDSEFKRALFSAGRFFVPYLSVAAGFLIWRLFIFEGQRKVTDVGLQLGKFFSVPSYTLLTWFVYFLQDVLNVTVLAWTVPLSQLGFGLRLRDSLIALGLSLLMVLIFYLFFSTLKWAEEGGESRFAKEGLWVGGLWVLAGLVFVILANRHVVYPEYSRYGFVSAGGGVILLVALLKQMHALNIRRIIIGFLLISATVTHYANATRFANMAIAMKEFWWQVSWRVPNFEPGTTIIAHYAQGGIRETSFVWGPANQIYFPRGVGRDTVQTGIASMLLSKTTVLDVLNRRNEYPDMYYLVETYPNPRNVVLVSQPGANSCVQMIDGLAPEYSSYEDPMMMLMGPYSDLSNIKMDDAPRDVPFFLFGPEPEHGWCFYYQKASLARQRGDWDEVFSISQEIKRQNLNPDDLIEWMPFLQAYALKGDDLSLKKLSGAIRSDRFVARQACEQLMRLDGLSDEMKTLIDERYCQP